MAIAKGADLGSATSKSSATTIQMTVGAAVAVGATVYVGYGGSTTTSAVSSITDSKGNTYIVTDVAGTTSRIAIGASTLTVALTTSDTITVTLAVASGIRDIIAVSFTGLPSPTPAFDKTKSAAGTSTTPSTGASAATVEPDELVFAIMVCSNGTTAVVYTPGTGYTADQAATTGTTGTNRTLNSEHKIVSATGAQTADATYGTSFAWDALLVTMAAVTAKASTDAGAGVDATTASAVSSSSVDSGTGADVTSALAAAVTSSEAGVGFDSTSTLSAAVTSADAGAGVDATVSLVDTGSILQISSVDSGVGVDATVLLVATAIPTGDLGGGGDAWAATGSHVVGRPTYSQAPPASVAKPLEMPAPRPTRRERAAALRAARQIREEPVVLSSAQLPEIPTADGRPAAFRDIRSRDEGSGLDETYDLEETITRRPPRHPVEWELEDLELLAIL